MQESATVSLPAKSTYNVSRSDVNGRIADEMIRYRYHLAGTENSLVRSVAGEFKPLMRQLDILFDDKNPFLLKQFEHARLVQSSIPLTTTDNAVLSPNGRDHLISILLTTVTSLVDDLLDRIDHLIYNAQADLASFAPYVLAKIVNGALPLQVQADLKPHDAVDALVSDVLVEPLEEAVGGKNKKRLKSHRDKALAKVTRMVRVDFAAGKSTRVIANNVKASVRKDLVNAAARLARTEIQRLAAQAEKKLYAQNQDLIKAETWLATLDPATCLQCGNLDGQVFPVDHGPMPVEDTHPNCRCLRTPIAKSWQELGVDPAVLPEAARRQLNGRAPERITWRRWFNRQPAKIKREILGKKRYSMYKDGKLSVDQFATNSRVLTLRQLKRRYGVEA